MLRGATRGAGAGGMNATETSSADFIQVDLTRRDECRYGGLGLFHSLSVSGHLVRIGTAK